MSVDGSGSGSGSGSEPLRRLYELFKEKGYGPEEREEMDNDGWREYLSEIDPDEYSRMFHSVASLYAPKQEDNRKTTAELIEMGYCPQGVQKMDRELWQKYYTQINQSEGFDIVDYPGVCEMAVIAPLFEDMSKANLDPELIACSNAALDLYNEQHHSDFNLHKVIKANWQAPGVFYITFEAVDPNDLFLDFQAKVCTIPPDRPKQVLLVRPKPLNPTTPTPTDSHPFYHLCL